MALTIEATFDDDLFDAEVLVERTGKAKFTAIDIGILAGAPTRNAARQLVLRVRRRGEIPPPAFPGGGRLPDVWSKRQVVAIVLGRLGRGQTVVV